jgi:uncharacterized protein (TIGR03086 family)
MNVATREIVGHQRAQEAFASVLANVGTAQLDHPTPCPQWTVRDLISHVIAGNRRVAGAAADAEAAGVAPPPLDAAALVDAHAASAAAAQSVFAAPDGLSRTFDVPFGRVPGTVCIGLRTADALTHAWDLARATGQPTDLDAELAADMLEFSHRLIRSDLRGPGRPFGPEQACPGDRPAADRLAAFLGRPVE